MYTIYSVAIVILVILVIIIFSNWTRSSTLSTDVERRVGELVREGAQYGMKSDQNKNALLAVIDSTYSHAYIVAAKKILAEQNIDVDLRELQESAQEKQNNAIQYLSNQHPDIIPDSDMSVHSGFIA